MSRHAAGSVTSSPQMLARPGPQPAVLQAMHMNMINIAFLKGIQTIIMHPQWIAAVIELDQHLTAISLSERNIGAVRLNDNRRQ